MYKLTIAFHLYSTLLIELGTVLVRPSYYPNICWEHCQMLHGMRNADFFQRGLALKL